MALAQFLGEGVGMTMVIRSYVFADKGLVWSWSHSPPSLEEGMAWPRPQSGHDLYLVQKWLGMVMLTLPSLSRRGHGMAMVATSPSSREGLGLVMIPVSISSRRGTDMTIVTICACPENP